jgi:hypothetical protein
VLRTRVLRADRLDQQSITKPTRLGDEFVSKHALIQSPDRGQKIEDTVTSRCLSRTVFDHAIEANSHPIEVAVLAILGPKYFDTSTYFWGFGHQSEAALPGGVPE